MVHYLDRTGRALCGAYPRPRHLDGTETECLHCLGLWENIRAEREERDRQLAEAQLFATERADRERKVRAKNPIARRGRKRGYDSR